MSKFFYVWSYSVRKRKLVVLFWFIFKLHSFFLLFKRIYKQYTRARVNKQPAFNGSHKTRSRIEIDIFENHCLLRVPTDSTKTEQVEIGAAQFQTCFQLCGQQGDNWTKKNFFPLSTIFIAEKNSKFKKKSVISQIFFFAFLVSSRSMNSRRSVIFLWLFPQKFWSGRLKKKNQSCSEFRLVAF